MENDNNLNGQNPEDVDSGPINVPKRLDISSSGINPTPANQSSSRRNPVGSEPVHSPAQPPLPHEEPVNFQVTDNKIPPRGTLWYVIFGLAFIVASALIIYLYDWPLLFFVVVFASVTLWRGHRGVVMDVMIDEDGILVNTKRFNFEDIKSYSFSSASADEMLNIILMKKYLPKLTYILLNPEDKQRIQARLGARIPEMETKNESYADLLIRKLKL